MEKDGLFFQRHRYIINANIKMNHFDSKQLKGVVSSVLLQELVTCKFIQERQNIVMIGNPDRGITHIVL